MCIRACFSFLVFNFKHVIIVVVIIIVVVGIVGIGIVVIVSPAFISLIIEIYIF